MASGWLAGPVTGSAPAGAQQLVGRTLQLGEDDYRFGLGPLTLRVTSIIHLQQLTDGLWLYVRGVQARPDGREGEQRQVLIRVAALPGGGVWLSDSPQGG